MRQVQFLLGTVVGIAVLAALEGSAVLFFVIMVWTNIGRRTL